MLLLVSFYLLGRLEITCQVTDGVGGRAVSELGSLTPETNHPPFPTFSEP